MSLAMAVISSTALERPWTRGAMELPVRAPLKQSQTRWLAIAAEPPLPQVKMAPPLRTRAASNSPAAVTALRSTVFSAAATAPT